MTVETLVRTIRRNLLILLGGTGSATLITFATVWLNARALGAEGLGVLTLIQAYVAFLGGFVSFGTQQSCIRLCTQAMSDGMPERLNIVTGIAIALDLLAGAAGGIIALIALPWFVSLNPALKPYLPYLLAYTLTVFLSGISAMNGVFRLFDAFGKVSLLQVIGAALNLIASGLLFMNDAPLEHYLVAFAANLALTNLLHFFLGFRLLRRNGVLPSFRLEDLQRSPMMAEFISYSWTTWGTSTINSLRTRMDVFVLGYFWSTAVVGVYGVLRQVVGPMSKVIAAISSATFTETSRLAATGDLARARALLTRLALMGLVPGSVIILGTWLLGSFFLGLAFGPEFAAGGPALLVLVIGSTIMLSAATFGGFVQAFISPTRLLGIYLWAIGAFLLTLIVAVPSLGMVGAAMAQAISAVIIWGASWLVLRACFRSAA
ncbi:oligosaccharide flippase family protein [Sphingobium lignivorans]|uniref:O-antigen/teichoic acid export membrane protein n=1 Tax=Sphingobium lignivorans TaxID=2735886 RepID=A0ABR6NHJ8_9SPHN|nr:oligosaccharide flippase family protein [Sphingobium lignivorans]MBB5985659.1 O-antigen/teichoic acid export membrane protein [Sphingobium lignivorans]